MTTIITEMRSDGRTRRCDASCHYAKNKKCRCICKGIFHGRALTSGGLQVAIKEIAKMLGLGELFEEK